jgi:hypothetical protein
VGAPTHTCLPLLLRREVLFASLLSKTAAKPNQVSDMFAGSQLAYSAIVQISSVCKNLSISKIEHFIKSFSSKKIIFETIELHSKKMGMIS